MEDKQLQKRINDLILEGQNLVGNSNDEEQNKLGLVSPRRNELVRIPTVSEDPTLTPEQRSLIDQSTMEIRVLHGGVGLGELSVTIGDSVGIPFMMYGDITDYFTLQNGFQTVTVTTVDAPKVVLFSQEMPFAAGTKVTFVVYKSIGGIDMRQVPEIPCFVVNSEYGCFRAINLLETSVAKNIITNDNRTIFSNVRYKEITDYVGLEEGGLYMSVVDWQENDGVRPGTNKPVVSFHLNVTAGHQYSIYIVDTEIPVEVVQILIIKN